MNKLYGTLKWSTVRKAKVWLEENNIDFEMVNIEKATPTIQELKDLKEQTSSEVNDLFNSRGVVYKQMNLKETIDTFNEEEKYELLSKDYKLIKRPMLKFNEKLLIGFKESDWEEIIF